MSRAGKKPIPFDGSLKVTLEGSYLSVEKEGKKNKVYINPGVSVKIVNDKVVVKKDKDTKELRSLMGVVSRRIRASIEDMSRGVKKELKLVGTGYRASIDNGKLILFVGYSHPHEISIPENIDVKVKKNIIEIEGFRRDEIGDFASKIRSIRPPEVYKGKGILYADEIIRKKAGKAAQTAGKE